MNKPTIETLTWVTLACAVVSACTLAAADAALPDHRLLFVTGCTEADVLSSAPPGAGPAALPAPRRWPPGVPGRQPAGSRVPHAMPGTEKV